MPRIAPTLTSTMLRAGKSLLGASSVLGGGYLLAIAAELAPARNVRVRCSPTNPPSFTTARTVAMANPRNHVATTGTISATLRVPRGSALDRLSDEQILTRVVGGWLGGSVLALERFALRAFHANIALFHEIPEPRPVQTWYARDLSRDHLPPLHAKLMGAFMVLDAHVNDPVSRDDQSAGQHSEKEREKEKGKESYIDLGFGCDHAGSTFCGVDRFAVSWTADEDGSAETASHLPTRAADGDGGRCRLLTISCSAMACNPSENRLGSLAMVAKFHDVYAYYLFKDGIARLLTTA